MLSDSGEAAVSRSSRVVLVLVFGLWLLSAGFFLIWWERPISGPSDSLAHVVFFAALLLIGLGVADSNSSPRVFAIVGIAGIAVITELTQATLLAGRSGSIQDLMLNFLGMAVGLLAFSAVKSFARARTTRLITVLMGLALVMTATVSASIAIRESHWWRCRDAPSLRLESGRSGVSPGPEVEFFNHSEGGWRWSGGGTSSASELPAPHVSSAALCAAIRTGEFTIVVVGQGEQLSAGTPMTLLASRGAGSEDFNFEIAAERAVMSMRYRTGPTNRFPRFWVPDSFPPSGTFTLAVRRSDNQLSILVDGRHVQTYRAEFPVSSWSVQSELLVETGEFEVPLYAAFFARGLSDDEIASMTWTE